jgi:hypothetical protein
LPKVFEIDISPSGETLYGPYTLNDNTIDGVASSFSTSLKFIQLQYSVLRNGIARTGHIAISLNAASTIPSLIDDHTKTADIGITFDVIVNGANVDLLYTTTSTGSSAQLKYYMKSWS